MHLTFRGGRSLAVIALAAACSGLAACTTSSSSTVPPSGTAPHSATTASSSTMPLTNKYPPALPVASAQGMTPSWLQAGQTAPSKLATQMKIGEVGYTIVMPAESTSEPDVALLQDPNGHLCVSWGMQVWPRPAEYVDKARIYQPDAVVVRTGINTFMVAVPPAIAGHGRSNLTTGVKSCANNPALTLKIDRTAAAALGYPGYMPVGTTRYVPGPAVWTATSSSHTGFLMAESSAPSAFPDSVPLTMTAHGLVAGGNHRLYDAVGQSQIDELNSHPQGILKVSVR